MLRLVLAGVLACAPLAVAPLGAVTIGFDGVLTAGSVTWNGEPILLEPTTLEGWFSYERVCYNQPADDPMPAAFAQLGPLVFDQVYRLRINHFGWAEGIHIRTADPFCDRADNNNTSALGLAS